MKIGKYMTAKAIVTSPRGIYTIHAVDDSIVGSVEWYPRWRKYVFEAEDGAVFSHDCMMAMAHFLDSMKEHK